MKKLARMIKMISASTLAGSNYVIFLPPDF